MVQAVGSVRSGGSIRFGSPRFGAKVEIDPLLEKQLKKGVYQNLKTKVNTTFKEPFDAIQIGTITITSNEGFIDIFTDIFTVNKFSDKRGPRVLMNMKFLYKKNVDEIISQALEVGIRAQQKLSEERERFYVDHGTFSG